MFRNRLIPLIVLMLFCLCAGSIHAQVSGVRIYTDPPGPFFYVDEQQFTNSVTQLWPTGSKHVIRTSVPPTGPMAKTQYVCGGWQTNRGPLTTPTPCPPVIVTADPDLTYVKGIFQVRYAVTLSYYSCSGDSTCRSPGTVFIQHQPYTQDAEAYLDGGQEVTIEAYPNDGWIFTGWGQLPGAGQTSNAFITKFTLNQPQVVRPIFQSARNLQVNLDTMPTGLTLLMDRAPMKAPFTLDWGWNTDHTVGTLPSQRDANGHLMIFDSWSDGGDINHVFKMPAPGSSAVTLSARFVPGAAVTFLTSPPGLNLSIDGRTNWPNYNFTWAQGATHTISAPLTQTDAQGRLYKFTSWSNGKDASQQYTVAAAPDDVRMTATYVPVAQVNISSVPAGITMQVDGAGCSTPCSLQKDVGESVSLGAPTIAPAGEGGRLVFQGWADSSSPNRTLVTSSAASVTLNATYQVQYQLTTASDPPEVALLTVTPASPDGFYNAQSPVTVTADVKDGYRFVRWSGDASGVSRQLGVIVSAPKSIVVILDPVPFVNPDGVKNGAGDTPETLVAPGSVISIIGVNLASAEERGPDSPLKQVLSGVTVRAAGLVMPLFFVSPGQINAQLPFEIAEGRQTLTVSVPGKPDVSVTFTVARNAPGLFGSPLDNPQYVMASHADGTPVTPDSPAVKGETITIYGTGFGPYMAAAPTGFALPFDPGLILADSVEVVVGDESVKPTYAGVAAQKVGVNAVSLVIGDGLPTGGNAPLKVRINGHESNTVILPLQ